MSTQSTKLSVIIAALALTVACATELRAQISNYLPAAPSAAQALTGGQQSAANTRAMLGDWESFSESRRCRSVGVERPGRDVDGGFVIRRQHESSAFERHRYAERLCRSTCDRYPRIVRDQRRDLEDSRGREFALGSQHAVRGRSCMRRIAIGAGIRAEPYQKVAMKIRKEIIACAAGGRGDPCRPAS